MSWTAGLTIDQVLAAAQRHQRHRAGDDLPAWGDVGCTGESEGRPAADQEDDDLGEEALKATGEGKGRVLSVAELGGHAIMAPGPDLACWLACGEAAERDDAALVTSITAWRKVTSWAQAQELAAVAELARRRRLAGAVDAGAAGLDPAADAGCADGDAVAELEAGFAPSEVALALTLTQGGAEDWMDLAVSLTRRLPATLAALGEGKIDLKRARLIDQLTSSLDADLARVVERRVLVRAENQTSGQLRASLQRAVLAADPAAAERRREEAEKRAWVALFGDHDGTASLSGRFLPAAQAAAAWARISAMAKAMEAAGAGGGMDLLRAHVFVGLLLGTLPLIPAADGAPDDDGAGAGVRDDESPYDESPDDGRPDHDGPDDDGPDDDGPDDRPDDDGWGGGSRDLGGPPPAGNGPWGDADAPRDEDAPYNPGPDDDDPDADPDDSGPGPHDGGPGPDGGGPGPDGGGLGPEGGGPRPEGGGPGPEGSGPGTGDRGGVGSAHLWLDDGDPCGESEPSAGEPGSGPPPPIPAWPPLPLPGAIPAPGCARPGPACASPVGPQDRHGPPGTPPASPVSASPASASSPSASPASASSPSASPASASSPSASPASASASAGSSRLTGRAVLCVPWQTLAGWTCEPGELGRIGPVTAGVARDLARAAIADVTCEWKVIVLDRSAQAVAVAKVRRMRAGVRGRSKKSASATAGKSSCASAMPGVVGRITLTVPVSLLDTTAESAAHELADSGELAKLLVAALAAGAKALSARPPRTGQEACTHEEASPGYQVPDPMRALVEVRDQTCGFPICRQPAWRCEQDHTIAYRLGGPTCPCNLSPECARHHHLKHLPSWRLAQPVPGVLTWTTPARLTHTVTAGPYPA